MQRMLENVTNVYFKKLFFFGTCKKSLDMEEQLLFDVYQYLRKSELEVTMLCPSQVHYIVMT